MRTRYASLSPMKPEPPGLLDSVASHCLRPFPLVPRPPSFRDSIAERPCPRNSIAPVSAPQPGGAMELRRQARDDMEFRHEGNIASVPLAGQAPPRLTPEED